MPVRRNRPVNPLSGGGRPEPWDEPERPVAGLSVANLDALDAFDRTLDEIQLKHHPDSRLPGDDEPPFWDDRDCPGDEDEP